MLLVAALLFPVLALTGAFYNMFGAIVPFLAVAAAFVRRLRRDVAFWGIVAVLAFLLACASWLRSADTLRRSAFLLIVAALAAPQLDELLSERDRLGAMLQEVIDQHTDPWG